MVSFMDKQTGPLLANVIMTDLENCIVKKLISDSIIKFYGRYVDDTLLVLKPSVISKVHEFFNSFHSNIQFTVDKLANELPHFLDNKWSPDGLSIFRKDTNTGQYTKFKGYTNWHYKIAWIRSLVTRLKGICADNKLNQELSKIRRFVP